MKKKITIAVVLFGLLGISTHSPIYAQNAKLVSQTTLVIPIQAESFQIVSLPFFQALSVESSFQIKIIKELPIEYKLKVGLGGKYVQKDFTIGPLPSGTTDALTFRIETPKELLPGEQYAKIMVGSTENSSFSATINLYLLPVTTKEIHLTINKMQATSNGKTIPLDTAPLIIKGRTFVPFRFIGTELGAKIDFTMNPKTKLVETVTFQMGRKLIKLTIGSTSVEIINDKEKLEKKLDAAPVILNGRTLVPLRFVSEELGSSITWDGATSSIGIFYPKKDIKPNDNGSIFFQALSAEELHDSIEKQEKQHIIDIRKEADYKKGHIPSAINIFETEINEAELTKAGIQKSDKIIIYCNSGLRNIFFCELLTNIGYSNVFALTKGLSGWTYGTEK